MRSPHRTPADVLGAFGRLCSAVGYDAIASMADVDGSTVSRWRSGGIPLYLDTACLVARGLQAPRWGADVRGLARALALAIAEEAAAPLAGLGVEVDQRASQEPLTTRAAVVERSASYCRCAAEAEADGELTVAELRELVRRKLEDLEADRRELAELEERLRATVSQRATRFVGPSEM